MAPTRSCSRRSVWWWWWRSSPTASSSLSCVCCCAGTSSRTTSGSRGAEAMARSIGRALLYLYPLVLLLVVWEAVAAAGLVRPIFMPRFSTVAVQAVALAREGQIGEPLLTSLYRAFAGLALAVGAGGVAGIAMSRVRWLWWLLDPLVAVGFPSPKITFLPIFILWFGIDHLSKILLVAFTCVFPMVVSTYHGAASVNQMW